MSADGERAVTTAEDVEADREPTEADRAGSPTEQASTPADDASSPTDRTDRAGNGAPGSAAVQAGPEPEQGHERWTAFAPAPAAAPGRLARLAAGTGRVLVHEWTLASLGGVLLAVVMTWPTLRHPTRTIPEDIWDPTLQAWQMAWAGHALLHDPTRLWHSNTFYPDAYTYAYSDTLLGYAPAGMLGTGPTAALLRYNIMFVLAFALAFVGGYALVRQLGATRTAATVAGAAFAYAPWRLGQAGHLHVISTGGIALALAMLARGHGWSLRDGYRPDRVRPGWALAGWLVAAWQLTLGFGIGLPFAYALFAICVVGLAGWLVKRQRPRGLLLLTDGLGGLVFVGVGAFMAYPYLKVVELHTEARRTEAEVALYSPPLRGFLIAPPESLPWGAMHATARAALTSAPEMALLPGFALYALAAAGLFVSAWTVRQRLLLAAGVVASLLLAAGTEAPSGGEWTYLLLYRHLPGFDGLRTPGRLVVWTTLLLGILAAGALTALARHGAEARGDRVPGRPELALRLALLVPLLLVLGEGLNRMPHPAVPVAPAVLAEAESPMLVLPSDGLTDENIMLWTTDRFPALVNGGSGFQPQRQASIREAAKNFPDPASVEMLRALGVRSVVVLRDRVAGTPYQHALDAPTDGLDVTRQEVADGVVYTLR